MKQATASFEEIIETVLAKRSLAQEFMSDALHHRSLGDVSSYNENISEYARVMNEVRFVLEQAKQSLIEELEVYGEAA